MILKVNRDINLNPHRLPLTWNYKKADWEKFQEIADSLTKNLFSHQNGIDSNLSTFIKTVIQAAKLSKSIGRRKDYKPYWNQRLEDLYKQLDTARDALEKQSTDFNKQVHKKVTKLYEMEKHSQVQRKWFEKTSSLNTEKDNKKLWQLTNALKDGVFRSHTILLAESGPAAGKTACSCQRLQE